MDLTKITTPFGLLDEETQDALKAWPHGWEIYAGVNHPEWLICRSPDDLWVSCRCYRACSEPPKPLELWIPMYGDFPGGGSHTEAEAIENNKTATRIIHFREVMDGEAQ